jgi:glycine dehydrogenase subunit 1
VAELCYHKAHYAAREIEGLPGYERVLGDFFKEFVIRTPVPPAEVNKRLWERGIIGAYPLAADYPELTDCLLFCVTEMNSREQIDQLVGALRGIGR